MLRQKCGTLLRHGCWLLARHSSSCQRQVASHNSSVAMLRRCSASSTRCTVDARHQALPPRVAGLGSFTAATAFTQLCAQRHGAPSQIHQPSLAAGGWRLQHSRYNSSSSSRSSRGPWRDGSSQTPAYAACSVTRRLGSVLQAAQQLQHPTTAAAAAGAAWLPLHQQCLWRRTYTNKPRVGGPKVSSCGCSHVSAMH
jgi:hypothetical protein